MSRTGAVIVTGLMVLACTVEGTGSTGTDPATTRGGEQPATTGGAGSEAEATTTTALPPAEPGLTCWTAGASGDPGPIRFEEATEEAGLLDPLTGMHVHASAAGEVNRDLLPDLVVGTFSDRDPDRYRVRGAEGPRPDVLLLTGPGYVPSPGLDTGLGARTSGAVFADLDGDGDEDLVLIRHAGLRGQSDAPSVVYENRDGSLVPATTILPPGFLGRTPTAGDFDGDGLLDLYVSEDRYGDLGGRLLINQGGLRFSDHTERSGLEGVAALSALAVDLDGDMLPDLVTSTGVFLNRGDLGFEEVTPPGFQVEPKSGDDDPAGVAVGDLDLDGLPDIVLGNHFRSTVEQDATEPVRVFFNRGEGRFEARELQALPTLAPHVAIADLDNDGWPDIVTSASAGDGSLPAVYRNLGGGEFEVSPGLGSDQYWVGAMVADFDLDGRLDVFALEWEPSLPSLLFRNVASTGHWLQVSVAGPGRGVGTVVEVHDPESGELLGRSQITAGGGYAASGPSLVHFGLGPTTTVDLTIHPPNTTPQTLHSIPVDRHLRWPSGCG